jgi:exopolyphosphatase/guanosine-5'-triphosphate,3'-diphosphate pyrophosphatase
MSRLAALDLGTNSTRFLCVDDDESILRPSSVVARGTDITRLGEGVDSDGELSDAAMDRVVSTVGRFDEAVSNRSANWIGGLATSACRRASRDSVRKLFDRIESVIGIRPEVIDGSREAELTYQGIIFSLDVSAGTIVDIGGGSTEWITFNQKGLSSVDSLGIGVVTLNERCVTGNSYSPESETCMEDEIETVFGTETTGLEPLVSVGGTGTTLASMELDLTEYRPEPVHGYQLDREAVDRQLKEMLGKSFEQLSEHPMIQSGREDVILPGIKILQAGMETVGASRTIVSDFGILAGLIRESIYA